MTTPYFRWSADCQRMKMITLEKVANSLRNMIQEVRVR